MSKEIAYIAGKMKEAERLKDRLLELLSKSKLESWDFTNEDIHEGWQIVDRIMMIDSEVSVGAALNATIERVEAAVLVMDTREKQELIIVPGDTINPIRTLEEF